MTVSISNLNFSWSNSNNFYSAISANVTSNGHAEHSKVLNLAVNSNTIFCVAETGDIGLGNNQPNHYDGYNTITLGSELGDGCIDLIHNSNRISEIWASDGIMYIAADWMNPAARLQLEVAGTQRVGITANDTIIYNRLVVDTISSNNFTSNTITFNVTTSNTITSNLIIGNTTTSNVNYSNITISNTTITNKLNVSSFPITIGNPIPNVNGLMTVCAPTQFYDDWTSAAGNSSIIMAGPSNDYPGYLAIGWGGNTAINSDVTWQYPQIGLAKTRGNLSNQIDTHIYDSLGEINFRGWNSTLKGYSGGAVRADQTANNTTKGTPTALYFVTNDGSSQWGQDAVVISANGNVGIGMGTTNPLCTLHVKNKNTNQNSTVTIGASYWANGIYDYPQGVMIHDSNEQGRGKGLSLFKWGNAKYATTDLYFVKSRGTTVGSTTTIQSGDWLGWIAATGSDGTSSFNRDSAAIAFVSEGTIAAGTVPGQIQFYTCNLNEGSSTEKMRITANGAVMMGYLGDDEYYKLYVVPQNGNIVPLGLEQSSTSKEDAVSYWIAANTKYTGPMFGLLAANTPSGTDTTTGQFKFLEATHTWGGSANRVFALMGNGKGLAEVSWTGGGADYAEFFEWADGNENDEDRAGYTVSLVGDKIEIATNTSTNVIGVVSLNPTVVGDSPWNHWKDKYLKDEFGRNQLEDCELWSWETEVVEEHPKGYNRTRKVKKEYQFDYVPEGVVVPENKTVTIIKRPKLNPLYDKNVPYKPREERKEWATIGLMGKLKVKKGQITGSNWIKMSDLSANLELWLVR